MPRYQPPFHAECIKKLDSFIDIISFVKRISSLES
jgi:hypothetical protein